MKRTVRLVSEEQARRFGKARLYAYGLRAVAQVAGVSVKTVSRERDAGRLDLGSLASVVAWVKGNL